MVTFNVKGKPGTDMQKIRKDINSLSTLFWAKEPNTDTIQVDSQVPAGTLETLKGKIREMAGVDSVS